MEKTHAVIDTSIGCSPDEYYRFYGTLEECQATNYVPDWVDMFAKDWFVLGGE